MRRIFAVFDVQLRRLKLSFRNFVFTALQPCSRGIAMSSSVRPSVIHDNYDKKKENSAHIFILYERISILLFRQAKWLVGNVPFVRLLLSSPKGGYKTQSVQILNNNLR